VKKYAIRFILNGKSRTYIVDDVGSSDAICTALDLLECDVPGIGDVRGLCVIAKAYPEGAYLAGEGEGPIIDTTRQPLRLVPERAADRAAA
jgi:hypothetical protein